MGDEFVVHMDREALNDYPMGRYDVTVTITAFEPDREIAWTILGTIRPQIGHVYGYTLEPVEGGTLVTSYYDWSDIAPEWREAASSRSSPRPRCGPPWESSTARWPVRRPGDRSGLTAAAASACAGSGAAGGRHPPAGVHGRGRRIAP